MDAAGRLLPALGQVDRQIAQSVDRLERTLVAAEDAVAAPAGPAGFDPAFPAHPVSGITDDLPELVLHALSMGERAFLYPGGGDKLLDRLRRPASTGTIG